MRHLRQALDLATGEPETLAAIVSNSDEAEQVVRPPAKKDRRQPPKNLAAACFLSRKAAKIAIDSPRCPLTGSSVMPPGAPLARSVAPAAVPLARVRARSHGFHA